MLTEDELESCRAQVRDGRLTTVDGLPINNETMRHAMRGGKQLVYVMFTDGSLYIGADETIQHSSFKRQVADPGQITFGEDVEVEGRGRRAKEDGMEEECAGSR